MQIMKFFIKESNEAKLTLVTTFLIGLLTSNSEASGQSCYNQYGDFMKLSPKGAGETTSMASGLRYTGVKASEHIAKASLTRLKSLWTKLVKTADNTCIDPALIAGLASRESNAGQSLKCNGLGDCKNSSCSSCRAIGILQCDFHTSGIGDQCKRYRWDSQELMELVLRRVLLPSIKIIQNKHPSWTQEQQLQGAIAAYNFGTKNVQTWERLDIGTTNNDYSNDVIARAQFYKRQLSSKPVSQYSTSVGSKNTTTTPCEKMILFIFSLVMCHIF